MISGEFLNLSGPHFPNHTAELLQACCPHVDLPAQLPGLIHVPPVMSLSKSVLWIMPPPPPPQLSWNLSFPWGRGGGPGPISSYSLAGCAFQSLRPSVSPPPLPAPSPPPCSFSTLYSFSQAVDEQKNKSKLPACPGARDAPTK